MRDSGGTLFSNGWSSRPDTTSAMIPIPVCFGGTEECYDQPGFKYEAYTSCGPDSDLLVSPSLVHFATVDTP
jgi:hypothetical protein